VIKTNKANEAKITESSDPQMKKALHAILSLMFPPSLKSLGQVVEHMLCDAAAKAKPTERYEGIGKRTEYALRYPDNVTMHVETQAERFHWIAAELEAAFEVA
jgi:hypothetical protein